ncbi:MAG: Glucose/mannose transporter GlcP [Verrucomicrobia bacterium ADurb.Bin345]|nr:MAG: Glucose/mannose transporter GlcP [Verrucomicrobia bacterium ADurb.Bin345]
MRIQRHAMILLLAYAGFISLGLPDSVIGVAWPFIRRDFALPLDALGLYFLVGTAGYFLASMNSGRWVRRWGVGRILSFSGLLTALCLLGCAIAPNWIVIVTLSFAGGMGAGAIDAGINTYAAFRFTPRHVNWLHACWGIGAATGPAIMTAVIGARLSWRWGYLAIMAVLLVLTTGFFATQKLWALTETADTPSAPHASRRRTLTLPAAWMSIALFFVYCGIESSTGQWAYSLLVESRGVSKITAGLWVSLYWGALTCGRFVIGSAANRASPRTLLRLSIIGATVGTAMLVFLRIRGMEAPALALAGFSLAPIFPTLISLTPRRFEPVHVANIVGFQVAGGSLGIALTPLAMGMLAARAGLEALPPALLFLCLLMGFLSERLAGNHPVAEDSRG